MVVVLDSDFRTDVHTFKTAAMTSFHAEKCCRLVNAYTTSSQRLAAAPSQFLVHSTFVVVLAITRDIMTGSCVTSRQGNDVAVGVKWRQSIQNVVHQDRDAVNVGFL